VIEIIYLRDNIRAFFRIAYLLIVSFNVKFIFLDKHAPKINVLEVIN